MSGTQVIPLVAERLGIDHPIPDILAGYRPPGNAEGRRSGWVEAITVVRPRVSRSALRSLANLGFTKVRVGTDDQSAVFTIEELLNA